MICPHCKISFFEEWSTPHAMVWNDNHVAQGIKSSACPNCGKLIVRIVEGKLDIDSEDFVEDSEGKHIYDEEFTVYPTQSEPMLSEDVPEDYKTDLFEAKAILESSPKASAAISRRLLQVILEDELKIKGNNLSKQIDKFLELDHIPSHLSKSIDAVRVVGNFAAHPNKETNTGLIVKVEPGEAEWLLEVILSLFDFVFIQPKRIEKRRKELNEKLAKMGKPELKG